MDMYERVFYQIFIKAFGSLKNITSKLDYLKGLGIGGIWLTPIYKSPSYHGYDVVDYYSIKPEYGTMEDFEELLKEAHARDIKVIIDMVLNHTSDQHEWFKKSSAGDEKYRNYYIWSTCNPGTDKTPMNDTPWTWNNGCYYYNSFTDTMPNLNHNHGEVKQEIINIAKYWIDKGVDGFRLDAVRWTYNRVEKGVEFWKWFREEVQKIKPGFYLVGEAWDSINISNQYENALGSCFNFDLAMDIIDKINWGCLRYLGLSFERNYGTYYRGNDNIHNSIFLSNHDQNRIYSELRQNRKNMEIAAALLLTLSGTPYIYYGEEIGMLGTKSPSDAEVRKPMLWEAVESEEYIPSSLLNLYKRLIKLRNNEVALRKGDFANINTSNDGTLMFKRAYENEEIVVAINQGKEVKQKLEGGRYQVLFSNSGINGVVEIGEYIELGENEILILKTMITI
ncbi:alpha-amylase [Clostridium polyendosporum]|uniref:Alpha-amylase n=1 Tax=Clostridium polyendosporum TaxID=69208 RepID=A0A919S1T6_9CLOT|nr:alpha-amylase family glycosyl hydrolase [Clostridium polyendosporum]GIM29884.1 alpha-amylase [Clostridium polyendosporum]